MCNVQCTLYTEHIKQDNMHIKVQRETESVHQRNIEIDAGVQCTLTEAGVQHSRGKGWDSWGRHLPTKGKPGFTSTREGKLKKKNENKGEMYFEIHHSKHVLEEYIH